GRLATPAETAAYDHRACPRPPCVTQSEREVPTGTIRGPGTLYRLDLRFRGTKTVDGTAHACSIGAVEREERRQLPVAAGLDIGVHEGRRQFRAAEPREVHGEKGDVGGDVGATERKGELDAVHDVDARAERRERRNRRHGRVEQTHVL